MTAFSSNIPINILNAIVQIHQLKTEINSVGEKKI